MGYWLWEGKEWDGRFQLTDSDNGRKKGKGFKMRGEETKRWEFCSVETEDGRWEHLREKENGKF